MRLAGTARVLIDVGGASLEADVHTARGGGRVGVVIIHPYPLLGGSMHDHVVCELFRQAVEQQQCSVVLKYNQRGVGRSGGRKSLWGNDDAADVKDVCRYTLNRLRPERGPPQLMLIGYSWGACLAAQALDDPGMPIAGIVAVSFPLGGLSRFALRTQRHFDALCRWHGPRLLLAGTADQCTDHRKLSELVDACNASSLKSAPGTTDSSADENVDQKAAGINAPQLQLRVFDGCDHFWLHYVHVLAQVAVQWVVDTEKWNSQ